MADREAADIFCDSNTTPEQIGAAALRLFVLLYGGKDAGNLPLLHYAKYMKMAFTSSVKPEKLPQTERTAYFHFLRVYHQVQKWNSLREDSSNATSWGWKIQDGRLRPVLTDEAPAPDEILNAIRCNCKVSSKSPYGGSRCFCRSNGLYCVAACGDCRGMECQNCDKCEASTDVIDQVENFEDGACDNLFDNFYFNH